MQETGVALAVDFGGTKVEAALVSPSGTLLPESRARRPTGGGATTAELETSVREAIAASLAKLPANTRLLGVGLGCAGPIGRATLTVSPLNVPAWRRYPIAELVRSLLPQPDTRIELCIDGLAIAMAEHWLGASQSVPNSMAMIVSTGIGGGLVVGGRAYPTPTGNAGHIGHVAVPNEDVTCACGGIGCVEAVASGPNSVRWARERGFAGETGEDLAKGCASGDPLAIATMTRAGRALGHVIAGACGLLDLQVVAIGGGFIKASPLILETARTIVAERVQFPWVTDVRIVRSELGDDGPLIGAAAQILRPEFLAAAP